MPKIISIIKQKNTRNFRLFFIRRTEDGPGFETPQKKKNFVWAFIVK